eukprot:2051832-Amphidinium_carterae.1
MRFRQYGDIVRADALRFGRLLLFTISEILWIISHHCACCRCAHRRLRRAAMYCRPYVVNTLDTGDPVVHTPRRHTPNSTARRSLAAIQYEISGGMATAARRCSRRRYMAKRRTAIA